jgi:hypothetical protein
MLIGNCDFGLNTLQIRQASVCTEEWDGSTVPRMIVLGAPGFGSARKGNWPVVFYRYVAINLPW